MANRISIDVEGLTLGQLADLVANARFAGAPDETRVLVDAEDNLGNPVPPHSIIVEFH